MVVVITMINDQCGLLDSNPQSVSSGHNMFKLQVRRQ